MCLRGVNRGWGGLIDRPPCHSKDLTNQLTICRRLMSWTSVKGYHSMVYCWVLYCSHV